MNDHDTREYLQTLVLPDTAAYSVADILDLITVAKFPCDHPTPNAERLPTSRLHWRDEWQEETPKGTPPKARQGVCEACAQSRRELRDYLLGRLKKAVQTGHFELWDLYLTKTRPLEAFSSPIWWAQTAAIFRTDLIEFCRNERIRIVIESEQIRAPGDAPIAGTSEADRTYAEYQPDAVPAQSSSPYLAAEGELGGTNQLQSKPPLLSPNDPPAIRKGAKSITRLAILAAWQLELETKRMPSADDVIERLQTWATAGSEDALVGTTFRGVSWLTTKAIKKEYDRDACGKALKRWYADRTLCEQQESPSPPPETNPDAH